MEWPGDFPEDHAFVEVLLPNLSIDKDYEQLLKDTEEKLNQNANSIEQQLKEIQTQMGDSPLSPAECLQWFNLEMQNSIRPLTTENQECMDFLRALQQYLKSEDDRKEELTLHLLLTLSAQCGVCFPCTSSSSLSSSPINSLHAVRDDTSVEMQDLWDDVRLQLRCHLLIRLSSRSSEQPVPSKILSLSVSESVHCLQLLFFLYPEFEVLTHYQVLRSQSVQAILHSSVSSSPGETGFDRLALGLSSTIPVLTQALTEELQVLSGLVEPHTILAVLNVAYFRTVAQELSSLMEKEFEAALRDNTTLSSKIKKYSARSRATVAPLELSIKNRSFSLTSHQLRALTKLACTLLGYESNVKDLIANMTFINCTGDITCVKGILKTNREHSDIPKDGHKSSAGNLLHSPKVLEFDWRSAFKGLVPQMEHCVKVVLDDVCAKSLQQEEALYSAGHTSIDLCSTRGHCSTTHTKEDSFYTYSEDTPKMIAKFCGSVLSELDALLPLALVCKDSSLLEVRSSFLEACGRAAFAMLGRLQDRALAVASSAPLKNLPALLATCIYVHQRLEHYHARLKDANVVVGKIPLTLLPIQKYQEMTDALREQLSSYCVQICCTCIFQDAESHHWADPKPFYEGERCSFSVQMWYYFLCGLRSDLWAVLPADVAKDVLGQVLSETLQLLVQRYARARPSYKRHLQIRADITLILLYLENLMWSLCERPEDLVRTKPYAAIAKIAGASDWPYQIHSLCEHLLTVLVIATAPLPLLYKTFGRKPENESDPVQPDSSVLRWLKFINSELFTERVIRDGLVGQPVLACQVRLLTSGPGCNSRLLLQMLLRGDCHLPRILLENSYFCQESSSETSTESCKAGDDFIVALFNIFNRIKNIPKALTLALQPYLERAHIWDNLYNLTDTAQRQPVLINCIQDIVAKSTNGLLKHLVSMVTEWQTTEEPSRALFKRNVPGSILAKIPKDWNYAPPESGAKGSAIKTVISLAIQAMSFILTNLPLAVASVTLPIRYLFQEAEKHLSQHSRQLRLVGLLLRTLLGFLIQRLEEADTLEEISGLVLDRGAKDCLTLLAECLQAAVGIQYSKGVPKPAVLKVLQALDENRPKWTNMQLQKARKLCSDSVFERERESAAAELTEQKIGLMLLEVCHKAGGSDYLRQIYHIIQGNEELLLSKLNGNPDSTTDAPKSVNFDFGHDSSAEALHFNPLCQFDHIGKKKLDQSVVVDWAWDWSRLLPAYQGMSQVTFKTLLANRWEMQKDAELEDGEKTMVEELKKAYFVCCCCSSSLGVQDPPEADEAPVKQTQGETQDSHGSVAR